MVEPRMSVQSGFVAARDLDSKGSVTLVHGGAGPISADMERSVGAREAGQSLVSLLAQVNGAGEVLWPHTVDSFKKVNFIEDVASWPRAQLLACVAVAWLESSPFFNAGFGGALQKDGQCRVTAAWMDSRRRRLSGVVNADGLIHPSMLACYLKNQPYGLLDAQGARRLMLDLGLPFQDAVSPHQFAVWSRRRLESLHGRPVDSGQTGTVGCVSCDANGELVALTSTGGIGFEDVGRIGDVASVAGTYCTAQTAISCTGYGEQIVAHALAARIAVRFEDAAASESLHDALVHEVERTLEEAKEQGLTFAFIAVHRRPEGHVFWTRGMTAQRCAWGYVVGHDVAFFND